MTTDIRVSDLRRLRAYNFHKSSRNGRVAYEKVMGNGVNLLVIPNEDNAIVLEVNGQRLDISDIVLMSVYQLIEFPML